MAFKCALALRGASCDADSHLVLAEVGGGSQAILLFSNRISLKSETMFADLENLDHYADINRASETLPKF